MHWFPVYLAALLLALPFASGQPASELPPLAHDPKGDVTGTPLGGPTQAVSGFEDVDLTGLWIIEDPDAIQVKLAFAAMDGQPGPDQPASYTYLAFDGMEYRIFQGRSSDNDAWFASLSSRAAGAASFRWVAPLSARYDTDAGLVWTRIDRDLLPGASGMAFGRGDQLTGIHATSFASLGYAATFNDPTLPVRGPLLDVGDRVPDSGEAILEVQFGGALANGGLALTAREPYRASNGAATTYLYSLEASNHGAADRELRLEALHAPVGWNVTLPGASLELAAGATVTFQVAVETPFFHEHGTSRSLHLRLSDADDAAAWAQVEIGVHYLAVPQPAGHHQTLFLHTHPWSGAAAQINPLLGGTDGVLTMNTLEDDPEDAGVALRAYSSTVGNGEFYGWAGCLDPGLQMGLDFDLTQAGTLRLPVSSQKPILGATLSGRLLLVQGGQKMQYCFPSEYRTLDVTVLANIQPTAEAQVGPNAQHVFEAAIAPLEAADRVAFTPGAHLVLELSVRGAGLGAGGTAGLSMEPGGSLVLPLQEYSDALPAFAAGGAESGEPAPGFSDGKPAPPKDAPGLGLAILVGALLCVARRRVA